MPSIHRIHVFRDAADPASPLRTFRQRPLARWISRLVQILMLLAILAIGLMSIGIVIAVAVLLGIYGLFRQWRLSRRARRNFPIQFADGR